MLKLAYELGVELAMHEAGLLEKTAGGKWNSVLHAISRGEREMTPEIAKFIGLREPVTTAIQLGEEIPYGAKLLDAMSKKPPFRPSRLLDYLPDTGTPHKLPYSLSPEATAGAIKEYHMGILPKSALGDIQRNLLSYQEMENVSKLRRLMRRADFPNASAAELEKEIQLGKGLSPKQKAVLVTADRLARVARNPEVPVAIHADEAVQTARAQLQADQKAWDMRDKARRERRLSKVREQAALLKPKKLEPM